ncbi:hypothetical protein B0T18DRAFT_80366 [Schizothecium vesticola]|uniref:Heterokaryon incompatibility domain-containing protein n=1 Tax=Schizothecium vesticola TaxID=314040 RepID=A0AA40F6C1_9PEZI|nr:hypothetical protein B0T18DRAFT_80366 [Schizothecium vesticola]
MLCQGHGSSARFHGRDISFLLPGQSTWSKMVDEMLWLLTKRRWWERTWVVQEVVLARKTLVYCGGMSAPWSMFAGSAQACLLKMTQQDLLRSSDTDPLLSKMVLQIDSPRTIIASGLRLPLTQVLRQFHSRKATNPRDKVFDLLELAQKGPGFTITPNYKLASDAVFIQAALQILSEKGGLKLLFGARFPGGQARTEWSRLPTWCVNWAKAPTDTERLRLQCLDLYSADGRQPPAPVHLHSSPDGQLLELDAFFVDEIDTAGDVIFPSQGCSRMQAATVSLAATVWRKNPGLRISDICMHICADIVHSGDSDSPDDSASYRRTNDTDEAAFDFFIRDETNKINRKTAIGPGQIMRRSYVPPPAVTAGRNCVYHGILAMSICRRAFHTMLGRGSAAIGPPDVNQGDKICIVPGLPVPLVLRLQQPRSCLGNTVRRLTGDEPTFAWLGPESDDNRMSTGAISHWMNSWDERPNHLRSYDGDSQYLQEYLSLLRRDLGYANALRDRRDMARLLSRNWFRRVWIVQEVVLSRMVVFFWGEKGLATWDWLESVVSLLK